MARWPDGKIGLHRKIKPYGKYRLDCRGSHLTIRPSGYRNKYISHSTSANGHRTFWETPQSLLAQKLFERAAPVVRFFAEYDFLFGVGLEFPEFLGEME